MKRKDFYAAANPAGLLISRAVGYRWALDLVNRFHPEEVRRLLRAAMRDEAKMAVSITKEEITRAAA